MSIQRYLFRRTELVHGPDITAYTLANKAREGDVLVVLGGSTSPRRYVWKGEWCCISHLPEKHPYQMLALLLVKGES